MKERKRKKHELRRGDIETTFLLEDHHEGKRPVAKVCSPYPVFSFLALLTMIGGFLHFSNLYDNRFDLTK